MQICAGADYGAGGTYTDSLGYYNTAYNYDFNGNITNLDPSFRGTKIDSLTYSYPPGGNQLDSVTDYTGLEQGYYAARNPYGYDANGNMTEDPSKETTIDYNYLNLPYAVNFITGTVEYLYDAAGTKLAKALSTDNSRTDYCGRFLYENGKLKCIFTPAGRIVAFTDNGSVLYKFEYNLQDHLGNTRVVFGGHSSGKTELIQQTDYYPFGLVMAQKEYIAYEELPGHGAIKNKYLYNGKELQDDEIDGDKLGWYDYGARFYDPALGRWSVIDNKAEKYYSITPYAYAANNPILFIDPDGNEIKVYRQEGQNGANPTVVVQVTGKLVNNSSTTYTAEQMQGYVDRLVSSISDVYSGTGENINFKAEVNITVASDDNKVTDSDHTFTIQDQGKLPGSEGKNGVTGNAVKGEKNVNISQHILDRKEATTGTYAGTGKTDKALGTLERTGAHELGHSATLSHPGTGTSDKNLMHQTKESNAGKVVTETQVLQIEKAYKDDKLNK